MDNLYEFLLESNKIEGIETVTPGEIIAAEKFLALSELTIEDVVEYVSITAPGARLRDKRGMDVRVGNYLPSRGDPRIRLMLETLLEHINSKMITPFKAHLAYESLHPFMDGNGRSGRLIWLWMMKKAPLGFLHEFYYQTLREEDRR